MQLTVYKDLEEAPQKVVQATATAVGNAARLARLADGIAYSPGSVEGNDFAPS